MASLDRILAEIMRQQSEIHRRMTNMIRVGRVTEVDAANGLVRVDVGAEGAALVTPPIPWPERAGARRSWNPPTVGEVMTVFSPGGEVGATSVAAYGGFTSDTPAPSGDGDAAVFAIGGVTITVQGDAVTIEAPTVTVKAADVRLGGEGGKPVARIGDKVHVRTGSSQGMWEIIEGSSVVTAVD
ncbi:MAG: hypothetical protein Q4G22_04790 [Paracoccus sp. (in: a-proteobacteria)]|uniref:hypothetical protein n=1 Tax=Paracoccus sp. TaxID=267 RepID=UPI0026E0DA93|nr:hypothetical protein [Paracoccus sp. (in: a-proteobacteria)]MDO5631136.1 hypothetical protein [Paracoccus sp. (in: a-proteobacteria)]